MATIKTPASFTGARLGIPFINGVGHTNDTQAIEWFLNHGYIVEETDEEFKERNKPKPFDEMTVDELREYMKKIGRGAYLGTTKNREKLIALVRKHDAEVNGVESTEKIESENKVEDIPDSEIDETNEEDIEENN